MSNVEPALKPGNRAKQRDSLLLMGTIKAVGDMSRQTQPIRIRNLSSTGLMADSQTAYDLGSCVEVGLRGIGIIAGEIVWVRDGRMGITFNETIDPKRARQPVVAKANDQLLQIANVGKVRRPGLRID